jgi:hypothetical protein
MYRTLRRCVVAFACLCATVHGSDLDEFKIKRAEVFEFSEKPTIERSGKGATITFASKANCDATVAIETNEGRILRHLASGVLGVNAPEPFQKNALKQTLVWDGKDDQGRYVTDWENVRVRVSLGLQPRFERTLNWEPHKRISTAAPLLAAGPEGVLVFEGRGVDHLRLFDHDGNYSRTIYPFPAGKVDAVDGLKREVFPQDNQKLPVKLGFVEATLLTSGTSSVIELAYKFGDGYGATGLALQNGRIAMTFLNLNRLSIDGTSGGLALSGPKTNFQTKWDSYAGEGGGTEDIGPSSMAFSPDGKTLYMTGYLWRVTYGTGQGEHSMQGVMKLDFEGSSPPQVFAGEMNEEGSGTDNAHFRVPTSVACDSHGRVYVSDFMNDRIQVFTPDGKHFKTISTPKPARVCIHHKTQEIYVFSYAQFGATNKILKETPFESRGFKNTLTKLGPVEDPKVMATMPIPLEGDGGGMFAMGPTYTATLDSWSDPPVIWMVGRKSNLSRVDANYWGMGMLDRRNADPWATNGITLFVEKNGKLEPKRSFGQEIAKTVYRAKPPEFSRQRLFVHPPTGKLYIAEDLGFDKSFKEILEIDPESGKVSGVELPFDAEDMCFDQDGQIYLRTEKMVARYEFPSLREVPWDYGEENENIGFAAGSGGKRNKLMSGLSTPGCRPVCWHQGGMYVSPKGNLVVSCVSRAQAPDKKESQGVFERVREGFVGKPYSPQLYPGRARWQEIHIWDKHGKLVHEDAVPGLHIVNGVGIDNDDNVYVLAAANRMLDGKAYFNSWEGTVMKCRPKKAKIISTGGAPEIPLQKENYPTRPPQLENGMIGTAWAENVEWMYGAVGFDGFNPHTGWSCACWNSRFALDYFNRSFAPEVDHYSVAVLDGNGNLILRIGRYGNVDDGMPRVKDGGPPNPRPIGGDEVALFHSAYLTVHTDHFLYLADPGNGRIVSVKLNYHTSESVLLKTLAGGAQP